MASGNLTNVPYQPGQTAPAAPADYNGWTLAINGVPMAGDTIVVKPTVNPGQDNRNMLAMSALADSLLIDGGTLNEGFAALLGDAGARVQSSRDMASFSAGIQADNINRQQNLAGVNLDEEAANLLRFQQSYQASAKIIQASQTLFESLLAITGR